MRIVVVLVVLLLMPLLLAGSASAKIVTCLAPSPANSFADVCDATWGSDCSYGYGEGGTGAKFAFPVSGHAGAWWDCGHCGSCYWEDRMIGADVHAIVINVKAGWMYGNWWGCDMGARASTSLTPEKAAGIGCPLGTPPSSPWGHVLP